VAVPGEQHLRGRGLHEAGLDPGRVPARRLHGPADPFGGGGTASGMPRCSWGRIRRSSEEAAQGSKREQPHSQLDRFHKKCSFDQEPLLRVREAQELMQTFHL
jgi:hypothetical protein